MTDYEKDTGEGLFEQTAMIPYFDALAGEEQREVTETLRLLLRQTFLLERKYDRKTGRFQYNREYRICGKHMEFIRAYFAICGISIRENSQAGVIYIQGETQIGDKLPRLATLYLLVLKLIYDEQMETVSTSVNVYTTLGEVHEKLGNCGLLRKQPSPTEIRRAVTLLKKHQIIEPLELLEDLRGSSRMIIYPCISMVLMGDDVRELLQSFAEKAEEAAEPGAAEEAAAPGLLEYDITEEEGGSDGAGET